MSLLDYKPERVEVKFKGGSFFVKGLSLEDLSILIKTHLPDLDGILATVGGVIASSNAGGEIDGTASKSIAIKLAKDMPGLTANLIALAAGEGNDKGVQLARSMSFPLQIDILMAVGRLTFEEAGGVKKFMETLASLLGLLNLQGMIPGNLKAPV